MGVRGTCFVAGAIVLLAGCAEDEDEWGAVRAPTRERAVEVRCVDAMHAPVDDSFWANQAASEATRPPPSRPSSISLGFSGDDVLTGGVTRDTPVSIAPREEANVPTPPVFSPHMDPEGWRRYSRATQGCGYYGCR